MDDDEQVFRIVEIEAMNNAKARAERRGDQSGARGSANQREMHQWKGMDTGTWALADDQVHAKIFHCGVKNFFDGRLQAVNFIEEENFFAFQRGENGGQVTFAFQEGAGAGLYGDLEFIG